MAFVRFPSWQTVCRRCMHECRRIRCAPVRWVARWFWERRYFSFLIAALIVIVAPYRSYVPIWDGKGYVECAIRHPLFPLSVDNARCYGHPSVVYTWYLRAFEWAIPDSMAAFFIANVLLIVLAALSLRKLFTHLFPGISERESSLLAALFIFSPVLLVHAFHVTPDIGVTCFFAMYLSLLVRGKYMRAAFAALALCFSKEVGAGVYGLSLIALPALFAPALIHAKRWSTRLKILLPAVPVLIPALLFAWYLHAFSVNNGSPFWVDMNVKDLFSLNRFISSETAGSGMLAYVFNALALNFQWILSFCIVFAVLLRVCRWLHGARLVRGNPWTLIFFVFLLAASIFLLTRVRPFNNARYMLACLPLLLILFAYAIHSLRPSLRFPLLTLAVLLVMASNVRTIDPFSRSFYGVFNAGNHDLLMMRRYSRTGYGQGRDELAYNLQFLDVTDTFRLTVEGAQPDESTVFLTSSAFVFQLPSFIGNTTGGLNISHKDGRPLRIIDDPLWVKSDEAVRTQKIFFIVFPNFDRDPMQTALEGSGSLHELSKNFFSPRGVHVYVFKRSQEG